MWFWLCDTVVYSYLLKSIACSMECKCINMTAIHNPHGWIFRCSSPLNECLNRWCFYGFVFVFKSTMVRAHVTCMNNKTRTMAMFDRWNSTRRTIWMRDNELRELCMCVEAWNEHTDKQTNKKTNKMLWRLRYLSFTLSVLAANVLDVALFLCCEVEAETIDS